MSDNTTSTLNATVALPVEWSRIVEPDVARRGMETMIQVALELPDAFDLRLRLAAGAGVPATAALIITGVDIDHATAVAGRIRILAASLLPFLGFAESVSSWESSADGGVHRLLRVDGPGWDVVHFNGAPWAAAARLSNRVSMDVAIDALALTDLQVPEVRCSIEVAGAPSDASLVASLVAADTPGSVRLGASRGAAAMITLPLPMVASLLAAPCRIKDAWPVAPPPAAGAIRASFDEAVPPHGGLFGGSGQGKTTVMEHRVQAALDAGRQVVVICPTGDLAARAASVLARACAPFDAVDFGDDEFPPRLNVCQPPAWVDPETHVADVVDAIEASWLGDMTAEMFGPMCRRGLRAGVSPLVLDPDGAWPLTRLEELLSGGALPQHWEEVMERIGSQRHRALLADTRRSIERDSTQHYGPWLLSKVEPFVANPRVRRIIDHRASTLRLERLARGYSLVVSAPSGVLGDMGATVMIGLIVSQLWHLARTQPVDQRIQMDWIMDEVHRVPAPLLRVLFAEARKYGVRLFVATQSTGSLDRETLGAVLANCGVIGSFRVGPGDAAVLDQKYPTISAGSLQRLNRHELAVTRGDHDMVGRTDPPLVDALDASALTAAHRALVLSADTWAEMVEEEPSAQHDRTAPDESTTGDPTFDEALEQLLRSFAES